MIHTLNTPSFDYDEGYDEAAEMEFRLVEQIAGVALDHVLTGIECSLPNDLKQCNEIFASREPLWQMPALVGDLCNTVAAALESDDRLVVDDAHHAAQIICGHLRARELRNLTDSPLIGDWCFVPIRDALRDQFAE